MRFCPPGFKSDTLTILNAFNEWASIANFHSQRTFCDENFLSMASLRTIDRIRISLIRDLDRAGVLSLAVGGSRLELVRNSEGVPILPDFLNVNGHNIPLLTGLISGAVAPGFAIRKSAALFRTAQDTVS